MTTKWLVSKIIPLLFFLFILFFSFAKLNAQDIKTDTVYIRDTIYRDEVKPVGYEKIMAQRENRWKKLIPSYSKVQFAGSMGLISMGPGWSYGRNKQWETDLLFGFVPRYSTRHSKMTMTVKQNFIPWTIRLNDSFNLKPFSTGLYVNTVFGSDYWRAAPSKYPSSYYNFSTKLRLNIFMGQGWEYKLDTSKKVFCKSITLFYEVSTNELYLISAITNKHIKAKDFLGLSLGVKIQFM